jgi:hypothetical protein
MVRTAGLRWYVFPRAALPAALAVGGEKCAGLLLVPTIAVQLSVTQIAGVTPRR